MDWLLRNPQIHSTFGRLGYTNDDGYHINQNCNDALETILQNILNEDKYLRTYRRSINFGQNINKDLIPLLIHTKDDKTIELLISILVNLTIPVECLLAVDVISKKDFRRHTIFDINNLLATAKAAFTDQRATKVILVFLKKNLDNEQKPKLSAQQCTNIGNNLLLLRNILHIPEEASALSPSYNNPSHVVQNQILFNLFSQSIEKILIKLMCVPEAANWAVTMVQLIALLYKDQHVVTLHKLLNQWLETSLSESSEDNESNTSPPNRGSENSSPILTSDPTSDSSDTNGSGKSNDDPNSVINEWSAMGNNSSHDATDLFKTPEIIEKKPVKNTDVKGKNEKIVESEKKEVTVDDKKSVSEDNTSDNKKTIISENSDCGYGTQIENQESISTSSNDDDLPAKKPTHQKPHNPKQRANTKVRSGVSLQERKRKKIIKRGKSNIINIQGLTQKTSTDDDISNILKEFTVEFLLKGYNSLVKTLHCQIMTNFKLEIDTSHFFWLVTYFLKFATQIELDLNHISFVLSYDIISYLSSEGVNLCEQFELAIKLDGNDLKPCIRRLHLVVTAIREFVQAIEVYKKFTHINSEERDTLVSLQINMCRSEELRSLLVLLLRHYNPKYHSKQYLRDLVVTNHTLLLFFDNVIHLPNYKETTNMVDHIKQFATPDIMYQYGLLLEDYESNGEYVNDCIFTLMHHVGGELGCLVSLFQPKILKTYTSIWKSEFEICDDWSDLIEYVINTFIKKPQTLHSPVGIWLDSNSMKEDVIFPNPAVESSDKEKTVSINIKSTGSITSEDRWTDDELTSLNWNYMHCNTASDVVGEIVKLFKEDGITKSREAVLRELYKQKLLTKDEFESPPKGDSKPKAKISQIDMRNEEIGNLCEELKLDGKAKFLDWVQKVLLETCFVKIYFDKKAADCQEISTHNKINYHDFFKKKDDPDVVVMSPVSYHSLIHNQSVPLVPWNCEQDAVCKDLKFLQLLHKLGFHMPVDTGKVFIRIPHFWTADFLYEVAGKVAPIDTSKLKFSLSDITDSGVGNLNHRILCKDITMLPTPETFYQIHKQNKFATMVNYTPMPGSSFNLEDGIVGENTEKGWLDLVRKSQEFNFKFSLSSNSPIIEEIDNESDTVMNSLKEDVFVSPPPVCSLDSIPLILRSDMNSDPSPYSANIPEPEYFKSLCETASVASDLTRMYVSDEEDKSDIVPLRSSKLNAFAADHVVYVDSDDVIKEKRSRVE